MAPRKKENPNMEEVLGLVRKIWQKEPKLRFCQIVGNCFDCKDGECYYTEDEELLEHLRKEYKIKD